MDIVRRSPYAETLALGVLASWVVYSFLYGLWKIPFVEFGIDRMSEVGTIDYAYLLVISLLTGVLISLGRFEKAQGMKSSSAEKAGFLAAFFGGICPACQGIQVLALGSVVLWIPMEFLVPYIGLMQVMTVLLLGFALYMKAGRVFNQACITTPKAVKAHKGIHENKNLFLYENNTAFGALIALVILLSVNSFMITGAFAIAPTGDITLKPGFEYGPKTTLKPMPLAAGESPRFSGYKSIVKTLPTISELAIMTATGDVVQDIANNIIPRGTPWYGAEAGVSFDDPVTAQKLWGKGRSLQLSADEQKRWERIVNSFTCDYCCGSPQNPTIITRCACAHSLAAQGMAKWFIKNYGSKYADEEIYGEMARWYALWYPGPTVKRIVQELQAS